MENLFKKINKGSLTVENFIQKLEEVAQKQTPPKETKTQDPILHKYIQNILKTKMIIPIPSLRL